jgi:hypothetical protein
MVHGSVLEKVGRIKKSWIFLGLVLLFVVFVRVRLLDVPLERDEGEYAYMGQLILQGVPPYSESYNMKFPGTYLMYAVIMAVFGQTIEGIHIGLLLVNCAAILLLYLLARNMVADFPAALASGTYAALSLSSSVFGFAAHANHFVVLPALGGTLLLISALEKEKLPLYFSSGALLGISVIMKQTGIFFVLFGGTYILWSHFFSRRSGLPVERMKSRPVHFYQLGAFSLGALLPLFITALWLYGAGVFERFWFWTVVYASKYAAQVSLPEALVRFKNSFFQVADGFFLFWVAAALGVIVLFFDKRPRAARNYKGFVFLFALFSFLSILPGFYFRAHYYITLLPAVSLLVGIFMEFLSSGRFAFVKPRILTLMGAGIFIAAAAIGVIQQRDDLFADNPVRLSGLMYSGNPFPESMKIAKFIQQKTTPDDRIAVFGSEPQIFFYANRRSATGYIYTYSLMENHKYALAMQKEMITEIEASKPKYIVDVAAGASWSQQEKSETYVFQWFNGYVAAQYRLIGIVDMIPPDQSIYRWYDDAKNYKARSPWSLLLYERR